ncbi:uncharacterized protein E0L32_004269 [Thyridium curvatum]|uniref:Uncharacterized protein n=1 Tax=Thyridium curvatum TaxID=1093900 RepID=A0A507BF37_9PEZI|nr:uncharacterized protein E0L32_004269 [Thyridium curvatum]TPX15571.1 hypothetical protein E0L32_004269 [Thyridium curvatum]
MRPMRGGRPNKVTKPSSAATARRPSRQSLMAAASAIDPDLTAGDDSALVDVAGGLDEKHDIVGGDFATAADVDLGGGEVGDDDDVMGDAEAEGEMVDDDDADAEAAAAAVQAAAAAQNLDLGAAAADMLANGGGSLMGGAGDHGDGGPDSAYPEPTSQAHGMDFGEAAHHHHHHQQQQQQQLSEQHVPQPDHTHPQQHQQHQPQDGSNNMAAKATEEVARDCGYGGIVVESALAKRLARERGLRPAQQRRPEQQLNLARRSNVEALFAHIAGEEVPAPCKNCHKGHGPWTTCVVVDGQMCGSCANCWYNASGARCSFHGRSPFPPPPPSLSSSRTVPSLTPIMHPHAHHLAALASPADANPYAIPPPSATAQALASQVAAAAATATTAAAGGGGAAGHQLGSSFNFAAALAANDPMVRFTVERAMAEVRGADPKSRQLMLVEIAAKQLALHMIEYEEMGGGGGGAAGAGAAVGQDVTGHQHQHVQHAPQQPAPDMGDDGTS